MTFDTGNRKDSERKRGFEDAEMIYKHKYEKKEAELEEKFEKKYKEKEAEIENLKNKIEKNEKQYLISPTQVMTGIIFFETLALISLGNQKSNLWKKLSEIDPTNAKIEYVNNDSLPDLVYPTGEIYLQTKEGTFVSYDEVLKKEKEKLDSIYQLKQDSLKRIYENKLEKEVKEQ